MLTNSGHGLTRTNWNDIRHTVPFRVSMSKQCQEPRKVKVMLILSYNSDGVKCPQQGLMGPNCECRVLPKVSRELPESSNARKFSISLQVLHLMWHLKNPCCHVSRPVKDLSAQQQWEIPQPPTLIARRQSLWLWSVLKHKRTPLS
jgi:hypothetical protein